MKRTCLFLSLSHSTQLCNLWSACRLVRYFSMNCQTCVWTSFISCSRASSLRLHWHTWSNYNFLLDFLSLLRARVFGDSFQNKLLPLLCLLPPSLPHLFFLGLRTDWPSEYRVDNCLPLNSLLITSSKGRGSWRASGYRSIFGATFFPFSRTNLFG